MSPRGNLFLTLLSTLTATLTISLVNWHLDPLGLKDAGAKTSSSAVEDADLREPLWQKSFAVTEIRPASVILGTSRAQAGLESAHAAFASDARPVYNLALGALDIAQTRELLVHAQHTRPLRMAVLGLDLEAFLAGGRTDFDPALLAGNSDSAPLWLNRLRLNLSWRALAATFERPRPAPGRRSVGEGFIGNRGDFQFAEFATLHSRLPELFPRWNSRDRWDTDPRRAAAMQSFGEILAYARAQNIDLRLFISPLHARYLELYRRVGWWPMFESWKRALVATIAQEATGQPGKAAFPLWDFSGFNSVTMEALPGAIDLTAPMYWYINSSHYSREHGNLILDRILNSTRPEGGAIQATATLLTAKNIEGHLNRIRQDADTYRATHAAEVAELGTTVQFLRRFVRRRP